jgi:hypothetical protein
MNVTDRNSFIGFVESLLQDYRTNKDAWENGTLESFLEAMAAYTNDIQGYYDNTSQDVNADVASWKVFADILKGASMYE